MHYVLEIIQRWRDQRDAVRLMGGEEAFRKLRNEVRTIYSATDGEINNDALIFVASRTKHTIDNTLFRTKRDWANYERFWRYSTEALHRFGSGGCDSWSGRRPRGMYRFSNLAFLQKDYGVVFHNSCDRINTTEHTLEPLMELSVLAVICYITDMIYQPELKARCEEPFEPPMRWVPQSAKGKTTPWRDFC